MPRGRRKRNLQKRLKRVSRRFYGAPSRLFIYDQSGRLRTEGSESGFGVGFALALDSGFGFRTRYRFNIKYKGLGNIYREV